MEKLASAILVARKKDFQEFCQWEEIAAKRGFEMRSSTRERESRSNDRGKAKGSRVAVYLANAANRVPNILCRLNNRCKRPELVVSPS